MLVILSNRPPNQFPDELAPFVVKPRVYLRNSARFAANQTKVINLVQDFSHQGLGYYVALLAGARCHKVIPSIEQVAVLNSRKLWRPRVTKTMEILAKEISALKDHPQSPFKLLITFGRTDDHRFQKTARSLFNQFHVPLLVATIAINKSGVWTFSDLEPVSDMHLDEAEKAAFHGGLMEFLKRDWPSFQRTKPLPFSLAVLVDPDEALPPSDGGALKKLARVGRKMGVDVTLITKKDYAKLGQFDALFIRETTDVDHHTFRFALRAEDLGIPVMDDSLSILRCTNKVFQQEALSAAGIPTPETRIFDRCALKATAESMTYPAVLKIPNGSFSRGIKKVNTPAEAMEHGLSLFKVSDLLIAQAFVPTSFDWRVGVLDGQPLFVCRYFMSKGHWQIVRHDENGSFRQGKWETLALEQAPPEVIALGLRSAAVIGNGFYGVDIKQTEQGFIVMEVNDNPNLESGVEDQILKDALYATILESFRQRAAK